MSELPKGWVETTIGEVADSRSGVGFPKSIQGRTEGRYPFIKVGDLSRSVLRGDTTITTAEYSVDEHDLDCLKASPIPEGSVLFAKIGEGISLNRRALTGREALADNNVMALVPSATVPAFLLRFMQTIDLYPLASATTVPSIRKSDIDAILIALPPIQEQRRIVAKLDELLARSRRAKEELAAIPALLERYRQSVLAAAFRGDLTADWREKNPGVEPATRWLQRRGIDVRTDSRGYADHGLPAGWSTVLLRDIAAKVTSGSRAWSKYYDQGKAVFVLAQNVRNTGLEFRSIQHVNPPMDDPERERTRIEFGDVLVTIVGANTGDCCDVRQPVLDHYVCQSVALVRPVALELSRWISMFVQRSVAEGGVLSSDIYGAARPHLGLDHLRNLVVPIPPHPEMTRALCLFDQWETASKSLQEGCEQHSNQLEALERAILTRAFRGELVPQDPADEPASVLLERIRAERAAAPVKKSSPRRSRKEA